MNIEKSFSFPFEDNEWLSKLGLGAVISMVPILNFAWSGYMVGILRNVMDDAAQPLPRWENLERKFIDGLILFAVGLVYALPVILLLFVPLSLTAISSAVSGSGNLEEIGQVLTGVGGVLFSGLLCVFVLYGILLSVIYPAILVMFAREGTFASCFRLREAFDLISKNATAFFTAWGLSILAGIAVGLLIGFVNMVVSFVPCIGWIVGLILSLGSGVYITAVYAHLFGQFGRAALEQRLIPTT